MKIRLYVTGGTFDKEYDEINGRLYFKDTHVREVLRLARCSLDVELRTLMMIDSTEMNESDRETILKHCIESDDDRIVITHGTDTMAVTAQYLGPQISTKTVVLTGALVPYTFGSSDGQFNLGTAMAFAQTLPPGVYVAMNGRCFRWDDVRKNRSTGLFETVKA
jgi:L-asparaginase